jgi:hypothetical protein
MSMFDEATCYAEANAIEEVEAGVLPPRHRPADLRPPRCGRQAALVKITQLMAQRLRTSNQLVGCGCASGRRSRLH